MDFKKLIIALLVIAPVMSSCKKDEKPDTTEKDVCEAITDKYFKSDIYAKYDTNNDGIISKDEAEAVTSLSITSNYITSLAGIEAFTNVETLSIKDASIKSLDLSSNTSLVKVSIVDCSYLSSVSFGSVSTIEDLVITGSSITSLDVTKMTSLKTLDCSKNNLTSLDVTKNTALESLWCTKNSIKTLDISKNTALKVLDCYQPTLTEIIMNKSQVNAEFFASISNMDDVKFTML